MVSRRSLPARIVSNAVAQVAGTVGASALSLVTFIAITRNLGPTVFGDYSAALALLAIAPIVSDLGLSTSVLRVIAREPASTREVVGSALGARSVAALAAFALTLGVSWLIPFPGPARIAALLATGGVALLALNAGLIPVFQAELTMYKVVWANLAGRLVTLVLTLVVLLDHHGLYAVIGAYSAGNLLTLALNARGVQRRVGLSLRFDPRAWGRLVRTSWLIGAASIAGSVYFRIDTVILAAFRPAAEVGLYAAAYKFLDLSIVLSTAVSVSLFPHLVRLAARGSSPDRTVEHAISLLLALGAGIAVVGFVHARHLLVLTSGRAFAPAAPALELLAPAIAIVFFGAVIPGVMFAENNERTLLAVNLVVLVGNVSANLMLIPAYGFKAAAAVTLAGEIAWLALMIAVMRERRTLLRATAFAPQVLVAGGAMAAILLLTPGPWLLAELLAGAGYLGVLALLPGFGRDLFRATLGPALARQTAWAGGR